MKSIMAKSYKHIRSLVNKCVDQSDTVLHLQHRIEKLDKALALPPDAVSSDIESLELLYKPTGPFKSTKDLSPDAKRNLEIYYHFREKAEICLTACTSWYGGDYFEFGSHDLNTFRSMLTAYDMCGMTKPYQDVRFYAFDIFGNPHANAPTTDDGKATSADFVSYFAPYTANGDQIRLHEEYLDQHGLFRDRCFLMQGLFENTLTAAFKVKYKAEGRKIGFAFLDCNIGPSYKIVFEFIADMMAANSYIYMDEYFQNPIVPEYYEQLTAALRTKCNIGSVYVRNAAGFGGLFRLYPLGYSRERELELNL